MHRLFIFLHFLLLIHLQQGSTQNLVPNPGFEVLGDSFELTPAGVIKVPHWFAVEGSTDFFHMDLPHPWSIPTNLRGTQSPASGDGAAGIFVGKSVRELLAVKLMDTLEEGQIYRINMQVNLSNLSQKSTDDLGIVFLDNMPVQDSINHYKFSMRNPEGVFLTDTTGWMEIAGTYVGQGNETYMLIGYVGRSTFMDLQNSNQQGVYQSTYYYIDNVAVAPCDQQTIDLQPIDTVICTGETLRLHGYPTAIRHYWDKYGDTPTIDVTEPGTYTVTSFLGLGCTAITTEYRVRQDPCDCSIQVPTLYSELYYRDGIEINVNRLVESHYLQLYDAHGQFILDTEIYTIPDLKLPRASGPYFWIAALKCRDGNEALFTRMQGGKLIIQN